MPGSEGRTEPPQIPIEYLPVLILPAKICEFDIARGSMYTGDLLFVF